MSDERPDDTVQGPIDEMPTEAPRRSASLVLREDNVREQRAASMEAANKSLADALRFTYRIIQVLMVVLAGLFFFSGFQQVNEGERGLRIAFGKLQSGALTSGFHFSLPYPMGQIKIIETTQQTLSIDETFMPAGGNVQRSLASLEPGKDGSLITGDGNIVHTRWSILYRRDDPVEFAANLYPDDEEQLVTAIVERAVVHVVSQVTIDDLLKPGVSNQSDSTIEERVRLLAQDALDNMNTGIDIDETILENKSAPGRVRDAFNLVNEAVEQSDKAISEANSKRSVNLTSLAGTAYQPLLDLILMIEQATAIGQDERAEEILDTIRDVLDGDYNSVGPVEIAGNTYSSLNFSGELSTLISNARQQRSAKIARAKSRAERFRAQLEQYRANPRVFLFSEIAEAWSQFTMRKNVSIVWVPPDTEPLVWRITLDPEHVREIERARKEEDLRRTTRERLEFIDSISPL